MYGDFFCCYTQVKNGTSIYWVGMQQTALQWRGQPHHRNYLAEEVNSDEAEKPCSHAKSLSSCSRSLRNTTFDTRTKGRKTLTCQLYAVISYLIKGIYLFPENVVTNQNKLGGLKLQKFIPSWFWSPEVQKQYCWAEIEVLGGLHSLWSLQGSLCPLPLLASGCCQPWHSMARAPASIFMSPSLCLWAPPLPLRVHERITVMAFMACLDNPGYPAGLKALT